MTKNKRGSHVGVVLSFLIFVTFLAFLYATLAPAIKIQGDKKAILDYLKIALTERLSENLVSIAVVIGNDTTEDCIELEEFMNGTFVSPKLIARDSSGYVFPATISNDNLFINRDGKETDFFKIVMSDEFDEAEQGTMSDCKTLVKTLEKSDDGYTIGSINVDEYFFETKIIELNDLYDSDYESLKRDLNISVGNEFGFDFEYANGTVIGVEPEETKQSIYIDENPVRYVNKKGDVLLGTFRIKVW